jgi:hypothetical protein
MLKLEEKEIKYDFIANPTGYGNVETRSGEMMHPLFPITVASGGG